MFAIANVQGKLVPFCPRSVCEIWRQLSTLYSVKGTEILHHYRYIHYTVNKTTCSNIIAHLHYQTHATLSKCLQSKLNYCRKFIKQQSKFENLLVTLPRRTWCWLWGGERDWWIAWNPEISPLPPDSSQSHRPSTSSPWNGPLVAEGQGSTPSSRSNSPKNSICTILFT